VRDRLLKKPIGFIACVRQLRDLGIFPMTPRGSLAIGLLSAALLLGAGWLLRESRQLQQELREAQHRRVVAFSTRVVPTVMPRPPDAAALPDETLHAAVGGAREIESLNAANQRHDLAQLLQSGLTGELRWTAMQSGSLDEVLVPFAELADLDAERLQRLQHTIEQGREAIGTAFAAAASATRPSDDQVVIDSGDGSRAQAAMAGLEKSVQEELGDDLHALYDGLGVKAAVAALLNNGAVANGPSEWRTVYTITRTWNPARERYTYAISRQISLMTGPGRVAITGNSSSSGAGRESLEQNLGATVYRLVPADFIR
jgi:hypothetical protein